MTEFIRYLIVDLNVLGRARVQTFEASRAD